MPELRPIEKLKSLSPELQADLSPVIYWGERSDIKNLLCKDRRLRTFYLVPPDDDCSWASIHPRKITTAAT
jgi:hypothetical protein